jgi:hypothetical protein
MLIRPRAAVPHAPEITETLLGGDSANDALWASPSIGQLWSWDRDGSMLDGELHDLPQVFLKSAVCRLIRAQVDQNGMGRWCDRIERRFAWLAVGRVRPYRIK